MPSTTLRKPATAPLEASCDAALKTEKTTHLLRPGASQPLRSTR